MKWINHIKWKSVWFWVIMQFSLQALCCVGSIFLRSNKWIVGLTQWGCISAVLYWQMRTNPILGIRIIMPQNDFKKWDKVKICLTNEEAIVIKKNLWPDGGISVRIFPYKQSRYRLVNTLKISCIKALVLVKCII